MQKALEMLGESLYVNANDLFAEVEHTNSGNTDYRDETDDKNTRRYYPIKYRVKFSDITEIAFHFQDWVTAYSIFIKSKVDENEPVSISDKPMRQIIVWRMRPEIIERDGYFYAKARLFIRKVRG